MATSDCKVGIFAPSSSSSSPLVPPAEEEACQLAGMEAMAAAAGEMQVAQVPGAGAPKVEAARCACCGLTEDCTAAYIERVQGRHGGRWLCGLCAEAVKEEVRRRGITPEEAIGRHMAFCRSFRSSPPPAEADANEHLIAAMRQLFRRSLDSPRAAAGIPRRTGSRRVGSGGFFPTMAG